MSASHKRLQASILCVIVAGVAFPVPVNAAPVSEVRNGGGKAKPNIIFILADDLSYVDLGYTGQKLIATPNIDRLAASGVRFRQAHSGAPECAPSRASLMTGRHMGHCRIRCNESARGQDHLLKGDLTIAELLRQAGYATGMVGKWGIGLPGTEGVPYRKGFDYAFGYYDQLRAHTYYPNFLEENDTIIDLPQNYGFNMKRIYAQSRDPKLANRYDEQGRFIPDGVADPAQATNSQTLIHQKGLDFIRRNKEKPFFLYYATQLPHGPVVTPDLGAYKDRDWDLLHKEWAAMVTWLDQCVGDIRSLVCDLGVEKNTVIFFAIDNGYSLCNRQGWTDDPLFHNKGPWPGGKFAVYEGGCRVPLCASWPGRFTAHDSNHICALYDVMATVADLAGVPQPQSDGISFMSELLGESAAQKKHDYLYWENGSRMPHGQATRFGPWYAMREHPDKPIRLFDVEHDPACTKDYAADHSELVARAKAIFAEAHVDSEWFRNPGENDASFRAKRQRAEQEGALQNSTKPNSVLHPASNPTPLDSQSQTK